MIFYPMKDHVVSPTQLGLDVVDVSLTTDDDIKLHAWLIKASKAEKGTILFLHGNAENISTHLRSVWWLPAEGYNVFLLEYRGYGNSQGKPSLVGLHLDAEAALRHLFTREDIDTNNVIVLGQSLGAAIAITALSNSSYKSRVKGLVVEAGFTSYRELAQDILARSWLTWLIQWPLSLTISDDFRPDKNIARLSPLPVLIIHSETDEIIPYKFGVQLYALAAQPKQFWSLPTSRHITALYTSAGQTTFLHYLDNFILN